MVAQGRRPEDRAQFLERALRTSQEVWQHFRDGRVRVRFKLVVLAAAVYVIWPVDLLPGSPLDDATVVFLAAQYFLQAARADIARATNPGVDASEIKA